MTVPEFWQGITEFNQEQFYPCHDTLEALWLESTEPHKTFYQGILQIAVACYHLGNLNWRGAVILLGEGIKKLRSYEPVYEQIDVSQLVADSDQLLISLQSIEPTQIQEFVAQLNNSPNLDHQLPKIIKIEPQ